MNEPHGAGEPVFNTLIDDGHLPTRLVSRSAPIPVRSTPRPRRC